MKILYIAKKTSACAEVHQIFKIKFIVCSFLVCTAPSKHGCNGDRKKLKLPLSPPPPHPYPSNNRPPQPTIAPWGNGDY